MGFFDDLTSKASDLLDGTSNLADADLSSLSTDLQDKITQYAEDNNVSLEAAKEHFLGGNE